VSLSRDPLKIRQAKFLLRKRWEIERGLAKFKWEEEVYFPTIEAMRAGKVSLELPTADEILDIEVVRESAVRSDGDT